MSFARVLSLSVLALASHVVDSSAGGPTFCATKGPESVLDCLETAYNNKDISLYEQLLAPDFRFVFGPENEEGESWGREQDLTHARALFEGPKVRSIHLEITGEIRVTPGARADTWKIDRVGDRMRVESVNEKGETVPLEVEGVNQVFIVQKLKSPKPHYVIVEWRDIGRPEDIGK